MIGRILAIALNTFREAVRNKVLYLLLLFALLLIAMSLPLGKVSLHEEMRVARDVGLFGIELFGALIAVFIGVNLVYKELDRKTIYSLIPKPIRRFEFVLGKYSGMVLTLAVQVAIMGAMVFVVILTDETSHGFEPGVLRAIVLLFCELVVLTSVAVLFSTVSSPILSGAFTLAIWVIGHFTPELREVIGKLQSSGARAVADGALRLVPDLHLFYVSGSMIDGQYVSVHSSYVDWSYVATAAAYGIGWTSCALLLACVLFSRRDFV